MTPTAPTTLPPLASRLPGPAPQHWAQPGATALRALVVGAHPGDVLAGFALGLRQLDQAGWHVRVLTLVDDPDLDAQGRAALADGERAITAMRRGAGGEAVRDVRHLRGHPDTGLAEGLRAAGDEVAGYDLVVLPAVDDHPDHAAVAALVDDADPRLPVVRYLLAATGPADPSPLLSLRRVVAPKGDVATLQCARRRLVAAMGCTPAWVDLPDDGLTTATDLVQVRPV